MVSSVWPWRRQMTLAAPSCATCCSMSESLRQPAWKNKSFSVFCRSGLETGACSSRSSRVDLDSSVIWIFWAQEIEHSARMRIVSRMVLDIADPVLLHCHFSIYAFQVCPGDLGIVRKDGQPILRQRFFVVTLAVFNGL